MQQYTYQRWHVDSICGVRVNMVTPGRVGEDMLSKGCGDHQIDVVDTLEGGDLQRPGRMNAK